MSVTCTVPATRPVWRVGPMHPELARHPSEHTARDDQRMTDAARLGVAGAVRRHPLGRNGGIGCATCGGAPSGLRVRFILLYEVSAYTGEYRVLAVRARHGD
jgi:hypothetical protein